MADKVLKKEVLSNVATQIETVLDSIHILPTTKTVTVRTIRRYLDANDNIVRTEIGPILNYLDRAADPKTMSEALTAYTDFITAAGIDIEKIKAVI